MDRINLAKGAGVSIIGKLTGRSLNFFGQVILARYLGPYYFGLYGIGWTILRIISIIGPFGLEQGAIRYGSKYWTIDNKKFRSVYFLTIFASMFFGLLIGVLLFLSSSWLSVQFKKPDLEVVLKGFAFILPIITGLRVASSITTVTRSTKYAIISEDIGQPVIELLFLFLVLIVGINMNRVIIVTIVSFYLSFLLAIILVRKLFPEVYEKGDLTLSLGKEIYSFSFPTAFAFLFGSLISWIDRLLVGYYLSEGAAGIYTVVSMASILFVTILSGIKMIFAPFIVNLHDQDQTKLLEELYRVSTKWGLYLSIPPALLIFYAGGDFLRVVFGEAYVSGYIPLVILVAAQLVNVGTGALDMLLVMSGNNRLWLSISALMLMLNIAINMILIPRLGINGAALGTGITVVGIFIIGLYWVKRRLNIWPYDKRYLKGLIAVGTTMIAMMVVRLFPVISPLISLSLMTTIAFSIFSLTLYLLKLDSEDLEIFRALKGRISFLSS